MVFGSLLKKTIIYIWNTAVLLPTNKIPSSLQTGLRSSVGRHEAPRPSFACAWIITALTMMWFTSVVQRHCQISSPSKPIIRSARCLTLLVPFDLFFPPGTRHQHNHVQRVRGDDRHHCDERRGRASSGTGPGDLPDSRGEQPGCGATAAALRTDDK